MTDVLLQSAPGIGDGLPSGGDVPRSPWPAKDVVNDLGASLHPSSKMIRWLDISALNINLPNSNNRNRFPQRAFPFKLPRCAARLCGRPSPTGSSCFRLLRCARPDARRPLRLAARVSERSRRAVRLKRRGVRLTVGMSERTRRTGQRRRRDGQLARRSSQRTRRMGRAESGATDGRRRRRDSDDQGKCGQCPLIGVMHMLVQPSMPQG
jgi:hypothetical protein